ncbi:MAG TPA: TolC family protein [Saprospiraceae bacterium]|nr:TolC family protein [Saprospiraceae bacterium]
MRRYHIITSIFLLIFSNSYSQTTHQLSLKQAVEMALQNAEDIKNLKLDLQIQELVNKEVTGSVLPQVTGSGQGTYYTNLPQIQFPSSDFSIYEVLAREGVKDQNGNPINTGNASFSLQPVSFVAPLNFQFGLSVNQMLFQPDIFIALKAKNAVIDYSKENIKSAEEKIKEAVEKAYYAVLIADKQKTILEETKTRLDKTASDMKIMFENGFAEKLDIDKLSVSQNNTTTAINQLANATNISKTLLKNALGVKISDEIVLTENLDPSELQGLMISRPDGFDYEQRKEISLLNSAKTLQELDVERQKAAYLPTVAAFYQFQRAGQRNASFAAPGTSPWFWFTTGLVGISVNQPIFDGFQKKYKIGQARLKLEKVDNSLSQVKRAIDMEQDIAFHSLRNALLNLEVQERNIELAKEVFETTSKKYESGLGSSFELIQADTELQRAQGSYFQALYEGYLAKTAVNKSLGKL